METTNGVKPSGEESSKTKQCFIQKDESAEQTDKNVLHGHVVENISSDHRCKAGGCKTVCGTETSQKIIIESNKERCNTDYEHSRCLTFKEESGDTSTRKTQQDTLQCVPVSTVAGASGKPSTSALNRITEESTYDCHLTETLGTSRTESNVSVVAFSEKQDSRPYCDPLNAGEVDISKSTSPGSSLGTDTDCKSDKMVDNKTKSIPTSDNQACFEYDAPTAPVPDVDKEKIMDIRSAECKLEPSETASESAPADKKFKNDERTALETEKIPIKNASQDLRKVVFDLSDTDKSVQKDTQGSACTKPKTDIQLPPNFPAKTNNDHELSKNAHHSTDEITKFQTSGTAANMSETLLESENLAGSGLKRNESVKTSDLTQAYLEIKNTSREKSKNTEMKSENMNRDSFCSSKKVEDLKSKSLSSKSDKLSKIAILDDSQRTLIFTKGDDCDNVVQRIKPLTAENSPDKCETFDVKNSSGPRDDPPALEPMSAACSSLEVTDSDSSVTQDVMCMEQGLTISKQDVKTAKSSHCESQLTKLSSNPHIPQKKQSYQIKTELKIKVCRLQTNTQLKGKIPVEKIYSCKKCKLRESPPSITMSQPEIQDSMLASSNPKPENENLKSPVNDGKVNLHGENKEVKFYGTKVGCTESSGKQTKCETDCIEPGLNIPQCTEADDVNTAIAEPVLAHFEIDENSKAVGDEEMPKLDCYVSEASQSSICESVYTESGDDPQVTPGCGHSLMGTDYVLCRASSPEIPDLRESKPTSEAACKGDKFKDCTGSNPENNKTNHPVSNNTLDMKLINESVCEDNSQRKLEDSGNSPEKSSDFQNIAEGQAFILSEKSKSSEENEVCASLPCESNSISESSSVEILKTASSDKSEDQTADTSLKEETLCKSDVEEVIVRSNGSGCKGHDVSDTQEHLGEGVSRTAVGIQERSDTLSDADNTNETSEIDSCDKNGNFVEKSDEMPQQDSNPCTDQNGRKDLKDKINSDEKDAENLGTTSVQKSSDEKDVVRALLNSLLEKVECKNAKDKETKDKENNLQNEPHHSGAHSSESNDSQDDSYGRSSISDQFPRRTCGIIQASETVRFLSHERSVKSEEYHKGVESYKQTDKSSFALRPKVEFVNEFTRFLKDRYSPVLTSSNANLSNKKEALSDSTKEEQSLKPKSGSLKSEKEQIMPVVAEGSPPNNHSVLIDSGENVGSPKTLSTSGDHKKVPGRRGRPRKRTLSLPTPDNQEPESKKKSRRGRKRAFSMIGSYDPDYLSVVPEKDVTKMPKCKRKNREGLTRVSQDPAYIPNAAVTDPGESQRSNSSLRRSKRQPKHHIDNDFYSDRTESDFFYDSPSQFSDTSSEAPCMMHKKRNRSAFSYLEYISQKHMYADQGSSEMSGIESPADWASEQSQTDTATPDEESYNLRPKSKLLGLHSMCTCCLHNEPVLSYPKFPVKAFQKHQCRVENLRKKVCQLFRVLFPALEYPNNFHEHTHSVERMMDQIIAVVSDQLDNVDPSNNGFHIEVILCQSPRKCVKQLCRKTSRLLQTLLPDLNVRDPEDFDVVMELVDQVIMSNTSSPR